MADLPLSERVLTIARTKARLEEAYAETARAFRQGFSRYDRGAIAYVDSAGRRVVTGQVALEAALASGTIEGPLFVRPQVVIDVAFEGGGARGFAYLGALHALAHCGIWCDWVAGTSAGAITAALIAAGYPLDLNYRLDVLRRPRSGTDSLDANPHNSLNRILFEDNTPTSTHPATARSTTAGSRRLSTLGSRGSPSSRT